MQILIWHLHGSWTTSFVQGRHLYLLPVTPGRDSDGLGRARTWDWPKSVVEIAPEQLRNTHFDLVVLQRPHEFELAEQWTGRRPGRDVPAVYVEHNTPGGPVPYTRHPLADQAEIPIIHVTHFNQLFWDCGMASTEVIEHGIVDPGYLYTAELPRAAVVANEPKRRGRAVGADLLPALSAAVPVDLFGIGVTGVSEAIGITGERLQTFEDLPQRLLHRELARRSVYVHNSRWTSLGLSLLEAMHVGMPIVALATTEVIAAVPKEAGVISTNLDDLTSAARRFIHEPELARAVGAQARETVLSRYGLTRFLADWDTRLEASVRNHGLLASQATLST